MILNTPRIEFRPEWSCLAFSTSSASQGHSGLTGRMRCFLVGVCKDGEPTVLEKTGLEKIGCVMYVLASFGMYLSVEKNEMHMKPPDLLCL